nr:group III truncated hemoglobin [Deinococcus arboris]
MYDRIGDVRLRVLLRTFYGRVAEHPELSAIFSQALGPYPQGGWPLHLLRLEGFWRAVTLGPSAYRSSLPAAHQHLGLTPAHFDAWLHLWRGAVDEVLPAPEADAMYRLAARMRVKLERVAASDGEASAGVRDA